MFEGLVTYSKVKRIIRGYVTHYTIKVTLGIRTNIIVNDHSNTIEHTYSYLRTIWEVSNYNGPTINSIMVG